MPIVQHRVGGHCRAHGDRQHAVKRNHRPEPILGRQPDRHGSFVGCGELANRTGGGCQP
jgi:hypothetical protein